MTVADAVQLLSLPRVLGTDPGDGEPITAQNGRYGPYVSKGSDSRSLANEAQLFTVTLDDALALLAQPREFRGKKGGAPKPPLREFGTDPVSERPVVAKEGRFGVYVTDGQTNASLTKGDRLEAMPPERAYELLAIRREAAPAPAKKAAARKAAAKRAPAKKTAAKKAARKAAR